MCSFIFTNICLDKEQITKINFFSKFRGPDITNIEKIRNLYFIHNLLSITGDKTIQPFRADDNSIICMYNGEIYNSNTLLNKKNSNDGECLIPAYKEFGEFFTTKLDGEFTLLLVDFNKNIIIISTDTFKTKPIFYGYKDDNFCICSYKSTLQYLGFQKKDIFRPRPNRTYIINLKKFFIIKGFENYRFDINHQENDSFNEWDDAFELAVKKRTHNLREKLFIGLSSGYDSGSLACVMEKYKIPFKAYSIYARENREIVNKRHSRLINGKIIELNIKDYQKAQSYLDSYCEKFEYEIYRNNQLTLHEHMTSDQGAVGLSYICSLAKNENFKIYLSGQGADEIFSDYGHNGIKKFSHSNFGGKFPKDLSEIFPWRSFYYSTQSSYLAKEEYVAGSYGIEARYPFLDKYVVQEFLWLSPKLKNQYYKAPLHNYLSENNYPFEINIKIGFSSKYNLRKNEI
jgi:asparagine synthetase B (glutamine-hydrolysing)